jgi:hypothetical protein
MPLIFLHTPSIIAPEYVSAVLQVRVKLSILELLLPQAFNSQLQQFRQTKFLLSLIKKPFLS